ncbi:MAG: helix-turn-helix domain-containing protein [Pseudomonadota bacterium]
MKIDGHLATEAVLEELGRRIAQRRIDLGLSQADTARAAGLGKRTVERLEAGADSQLSTLLRLLRVLDLTDGVEALVPSVGISPMDLLKLKGKERRRAPRGDAPRAESAWRWGDEE